MRLARRARVIFTLVSAWVELHTSFKVNVKQKLGRPLKKKEYFYGLKNLVIVSFFCPHVFFFPACITASLVESRRTKINTWNYSCNIHISSVFSGDTFTFSDVTRNVLLYHHSGLSTQDDAITFSVSDGISMAATVVQVVVLGAGGSGPQQDPIATLSLEVGEKSSTVIRRSHLAYTVS